MASKRESIKDRGGKLLGYVVTEPNGNKVIWNREGNKILGYYRASSGITTTATGRLVSYGDTSVALIPGVANLVK